MVGKRAVSLDTHVDGVTDLDLIIYNLIIYRHIQRCASISGTLPANKFICHVRLKRSGAWWYVDGSNQMLALQCATYNRTFDRVFERYQERLMAGEQSPHAPVLCRPRRTTHYAQIIKNGSSMKLFRHQGQRPGLLNRARLRNTKPQERQHAGSTTRRCMP
jgi:hypothetical protein